MLLEVRTKCRTKSDGDTYLQTQLASRNQHRVLKLKRNVYYSREVVWYVKRQYTPYSLKVKRKSQTRKRSRRAFGDIACQSIFACSFKVKKQRLLQQPSCLACKTLVYALQFVRLWPKVHTKWRLERWLPCVFWIITHQS